MLVVQTPQLEIPYGAFLPPFPAFFAEQLSSCLGLPFSGVALLVILFLEPFACLLRRPFVAPEPTNRETLLLHVPNLVAQDFLFRPLTSEHPKGLKFGN